MEVTVTVDMFEWTKKLYVWEWLRLNLLNSTVPRSVYIRLKGRKTTRVVLGCGKAVPSHLQNWLRARSRIEKIRRKRGIDYYPIYWIGWWFNSVWHNGADLVCS